MDAKTINSPQSLWEHLDISQETIQYNETGTIVSTRSEPPNSPTNFERLPRFVLESDTPNAEDTPPLADLNIKETIGQGGMGIVQRAVQIPLQRDVAVKRIRTERLTERERDGLLREAWITGLLEHPNIVPIHALGVDPSGAPMFVMKRIEGVSWQTLLSQPEHPWIQAISNDPLLSHLSIFRQVCNAVQFAHSKHILHCDLKLENVMVGEFGEVYLLDWGIAVSMKEHPSLPLPLVSDIKGITGTPSSMAPEMVRVDTQNIGPTTDVYLLGTILHELLTHQPRHVGSDIKQVLFRAFLSEPFEYSESVPRELASICNQATHADPTLRFPSVEALRHAMDDFLQHRTSIRLNSEAEAILQELKRCIQASDSNTNDEQRLRIYSLFSECRFGFAQALQTWNENPHAQAGLEDALHALVEFEIQQGDYKAALLHFNALKSPSFGLQERLHTLKLENQARAEKEIQLQKFYADRNLNTGKRTRAFLSVAGGSVFFPFALLYSKTCGTLTFTYKSYYFLDAAFLGLMLFITLWARETMFRTSVNRSILVSLWSLAFLMLIHTTGMLLLGIPARDAFAQTPFLYGLQTAAMAALLEPKLFGAAAVFMLAFFGSVTFVTYTFEIVAASVLIGLIFAGLAWHADILEQTDTFLSRLLRPKSAPTPEQKPSP